ncbi:MAG: 50S ribosomal protein L18e [Euryarchaeota archaeon]|nr:50S ribosomal protein L18e [Euryarchaeota archaeon]|tara:strand:+ start:33716 stop:34081 length:366 start_codon:yes stop_codon:yes gene_type:complete
MSKNSRKTNKALITLIGDLKAQSRSTGAALWRDVANRLESSRSNWAEPNLSRLSRTASENETVLVPGKLLGSGDVAGSPNVAAYSVSASARSKIEAAGGRVMSIRDLMEDNPNGTGVRIIG